MATLNDICYEHIIDSFSYGLYGDFNLIIDRSTGCFNATKLCTKGGKHFYHWTQSKRTKELIELVRQRIQKSNPNAQILYVVEGTKNDTYNKIVSGTYVREEFILDIALWISREFYFNALQIVTSYFANEYSEKYKNDIEELKRKYEENETKFIELAQKNNELEQKNNDLSRKNIELKRINQKYQDVEEDISPKTLNQSKRNTFILFDKCMPDEIYKYSVKRIQSGSKIKILKDLRKKYPTLKILFQIDYNPNSINFFNLAKENLKDVKYYRNDVRLLNKYTIEHFICDLKLLSLQKF